MVMVLLWLWWRQLVVKIRRPSVDNAAPSLGWVGDMGIPFGYTLLVYLAQPNMEKVQQGNPKK
jgi:hypothetical protein